MSAASSCLLLRISSTTAGGFTIAPRLTNSREKSDRISCPRARHSLAVDIDRNLIIYSEACRWMSFILFIFRFLLLYRVPVRKCSTRTRTKWNVQSWEPIKIRLIDIHSLWRATWIFHFSALSRVRKQRDVTTVLISTLSTFTFTVWILNVITLLDLTFHLHC